VKVPSAVRLPSSSYVNASFGSFGGQLLVSSVVVY
jgi:hypothetical protein